MLHTSWKFECFDDYVITTVWPHKYNTCVCVPVSLAIAQHEPQHKTVAHMSHTTRVQVCELMCRASPEEGPPVVGELHLAIEPQTLRSELWRSEGEDGEAILAKCQMWQVTANRGCVITCCETVIQYITCGNMITLLRVCC